MTGPALNGWFDLKNKDTSLTIYSERVSHLEAGGRHLASWKSPGAMPRRATILIAYQSMSGATYETEIGIEENRLKDVFFRSDQFESPEEYEALRP